MGNDTESGCIVGLVWLGTIVISIVTGIIAWDWVEPESFFQAIIFLAVWSVLSWLGYLVMGAIAILFAQNK